MTIALTLAALFLLLGGWRNGRPALLLQGVGALWLADPGGAWLQHTAAPALLPWLLASALPIAGAWLLAAGAWLAWADARRRRDGQVAGSVAPLRSPARAWAHLGLRAVIAGLVAMLAFGLGALVPALFDARPPVLSHAAAAVIVLLVWAGWALLELRGPGRPSRGYSGAA